MRLYTITGIQGFSETYGCSTYGSGAYNSSAACGASTTSGSGSNGTLTNTGIMVSVIVGVAALLLLVAILVRFWRRPAQLATVPVTEDEPQDDTQNREL
jgi:hypothetical protein